MSKDLNDYQKIFKNAKRIVVKVGTSCLTYDTGKLNLLQLEKLVRQLADLKNQGKEIILVSSGAVGAGVGKLGLDNNPKTMPEKQALAAIGQGILLQMYEKLFSEYGQTIGQVLITKEDLADRKRYLNARYTFFSLLQYGVIPIVNENDTVAVEEIRFGDNDTLSALVAGLVDSDLLVLLTDIDGLYNCNPKYNKDAKLLNIVEEISAGIEEIAGGAGTNLGTGGMFTKIQAAKVSINSGIPMVIANGSNYGILQRIVSGNFKGTLFVSKEERLHSKKRWLGYSSCAQGKIKVDTGAKKALLEKGKSLLPAGIIGLEGNFEIGNVVSIIDIKENEFARGIVNYSSSEVNKIIGKNSLEIKDILGYKDYDEVIHRDNLCLVC